MRRFVRKATAVAAVWVGILLATNTSCSRRERSTVNASDTYQRACARCHGDRGLAGGNAFAGPFGVVYAANITSHPASGIGAYSDEDLKRVFREGRSKDGRSLWVMPWSATMGLHEEDLVALIAALREVAPNPNLVPARKLLPAYEETESP